MSNCCGCSNALYNSGKKKVFDVGCKIYQHRIETPSTDLNDIYQSEYTIEKSGYYAIYFSGHGAKLADVMIYYPAGTNTVFQKLNAGDRVRYKLGKESSVFLKSGKEIKTGVSPNAVVGREINKASIYFHYLGQISEPVLILTDQGFREGTEGFDRFLEGTRYANQAHVLEPQLRDIRYDATGHVRFSFFAVTKFTVPESKTYRIGSSGDDYANVYIDGEPALWLAKNNSSRSLLVTNQGANSAYNTLLENDVFLTAGEHELCFWNCSPICCNISGIVAVKDPTTNEVYAYADGANYKYVRSDLDCIDSIEQVKWTFTAENPNYTIKEI